LPAGNYVVRFGSSDGVDNAGQPLDYSSWYNGEADDTAGDRSGAVVITVSDTEPTEVIESYAVTRGSISGWAANAHHATVTAYAVPSGKVVDTIEAGGTTGYFAFEDAHALPAQNYRVSIAKAGYATIFVGSSGDVAYSLADAPTVTAKTGSFFDLGDVYLQSESTITGTVTDGSNPVPGALVAAYVADTNHLATTTRAAADGTFTLHGLSGIGYKLAFITPGNTHQPMVLGAGTGPGVSPSLNDGSTFSLQAGGTLSLGTVSLTQGADCATAQSGGTELDGADLHNCNLSTADLTNTKLDSANLSGANLSTATLPDFLLTSSPEMYGADLSNANLSHVESPSGGSAYLGGSDVSGADLSHADLTSVTLTGADLSGANLSHANLSHGAIDESNVSGADLSSATFSYTMTNDLSWSTPPTLPAGYKFVGSTLLGAGVGMSGVDLSGADLSGMDLSKLWLTTTNLSGADLSNATLTDITWNEVDLSGANLAGATLSVGYAGHLTHDENTVLPAGWDIVNGTFVHTSP
jgi:uncharacterized protein YjbI with pentapeptide repeats